MLKFSLTQPIYAFKSYAYKKECILDTLCPLQQNEK